MHTMINDQKCTAYVFDPLIFFIKVRMNIKACYIFSLQYLQYKTFIICRNVLFKERYSYPFFFIPVFSEHFKVCTIFDLAQIDCPVYNFVNPSDLPYY